MWAACDVTEPEDVEAAVGLAESRLGPIDTLSCNAGVGRSDGATTEPLSDWNRTLAVHLGGAWNSCRSVIRRVREGGGTASIVIATSATSYVDGPGSAAVCAAEGGVVGLTRALALDYARERIRVNCIYSADVSATVVLPRIAKEETGGAPDLAGHHSRTSERSMTLAERVAGMVVFLASDDASFMTGAAVSAATVTTPARACANEESTCDLRGL